MAVLKKRLRQKNSSGSYDTIHLETSSSVVLRSDGTTVEEALASVDPNHKHSAADITSGTLPIVRGGTGASTAAAALTNLGAAASNHTHSGYAASTHSHAAGDITSGTLPVARGGTGATSAAAALTSLGAAAADHTHTGYAASSHTHAAGDITSGTLAVARGGTGNTSVDTAPVSGSTKMVTSGGVYTALAGKSDTSHTHAYLPLTGGNMTGNVVYRGAGLQTKFISTQVTKGTAPTSNRYFMQMPFYETVNAGSEGTANLVGNFHVMNPKNTKSISFRLYGYKHVSESTDSTCIVNHTIATSGDEGSETTTTTTVFGGKVTVPVGTDYMAAKVRNISANTTAYTAGTTALSNGNIYLQYE